MFKKIGLASIILICILVVVYGYINEIKPFMIGFTAFACLTICLWHEYESRKKFLIENDRRKPSPISSLEERPYRVFWWRNIDSSYGAVLIPLIVKGEDLNPNRYYPIIIKLGDQRPHSKYVTPAFSDNGKEILYFDEYPEGKVTKTQFGEQIEPECTVRDEFGG
jgi:hypothetical protein